MTNIFIASTWLDQLLTDFINKKGSDIHIEPFEHKHRVRIRYDGLLQPYAELNLEQGEAVISRLKVLAHCDIAEKRLPQDGRLQYEKFHSYDFRLSVCPTVYGEKIVIRNLNTLPENFSLTILGMSEEQRTILQNILSQPQGLILVTGPTGSGKTVTLYSALQILNHINRNIVTIEDPVEIFLQGINQTSINPKAGLNFSTILKNILRQDPDIIMVGEMRDYETTELALAAAQTGHLVLSTLHTNTTTDSIIRLLQMGFENYQIQSSLLMVIAQRLVRRLCEYCKTPAANTAYYYQKILPHFLPRGCSHCFQGYRSRTALYELLPLNDELHHIIQAKDLLALKSYRQKIFTIQDHAVEKVIAGETSIAEIQRVLGK